MFIITFEGTILQMEKIRYREVNNLIKILQKQFLNQGLIGQG